jgi:glycine cleavage system H protein
MSELIESLQYAATHEWVSLEADNVVRVGITDFAQSQLGDVVFVDLPEVGRKLSLHEPCAVIESVKTASDLYSPVTGEVIAVNETVVDAPEQLNDAPYATWLFCIRAEDVSELSQLLSADEYRQSIDE